LVDAKANTVLAAVPHGGTPVDERNILIGGPSPAFAYRDVPVWDGANGGFIHHDGTVGLVDAPAEGT
jgi:hypothetical protein